MIAGSQHEAPTELDDGRWELLRALGSVAMESPPASDSSCEALGLPRWERYEHTNVFVLDLPPHASVYLGGEGGIGGTVADAAAGIWRAMGLVPPDEPDHLGALLALYAHLGESVARCTTAAAPERLRHAMRVILWEHLWTWCPSYLGALAAGPADGSPAKAWAALLDAALKREASLSEPPSVLPSVLGGAPAPISADPSLDELLDTLTATVRSGFIVTFTDLSSAAKQVGVGLRRGERRFALRSMLEQDPGGTLSWMAEHARLWESWHTAASFGPDGNPGPGQLIAEWWASRAAHTATVLEMVAGTSRER